MKAYLSLKLALIASLPFSFFSVYGQLPVSIGQWRLHYAYENVTHLAMVSGKLYCSNNVALYSYDPEDFSYTALSKKDGLTGTDISALGDYDENVLLVGYSDGNIDFVNKNAVSQFSDIQRANLTGSKRINHFYQFGSNILVSTDYGLSVINVDRTEVSDSYINISSDGSSNPFYAAVLSENGDSIFVASQDGILGAAYNPGVNLRDYNNWKVFSSGDGLPAGETKAVGRLGSIVFAGVGGNGIYYYNGSQWQSTGITGTTIKSISTGDHAIVACVDDKTYKITSATNNQFYTDGWLNNPYNALMDGAGNIWYANPNAGLVIINTSIHYVGQPNGPFTNDTYRLKYFNETVVNCRGGIDVSYGNIYKESGIMLLGNDDVWKSYTIYDGLPSQTRDLLDAAIHPASGKWYLPTFGWGLIQYDLTTRTSVLYDTTNSPLKVLYLTSATTDKSGAVWIGAHSQANRNGNSPFLHTIDPAGTTWYSYKANQSNGRYPQEIVIDQQSNKWIRLAASGGIRGLMMFKEINPVSGSSTQIYFGVEDNTGALPNISVNTINVDKTGQVWIGTDQGICVFTNPSQIKPGSIPKAYLPIVNGFPLFFDKKINCIKTDAANRKWVGTPDGVFLLSADGLETIHKFDITNSPLIDNNINTITINDKNGEVFFGTDKGIISYRGDATVGEEIFNDVKIFPNPVTRDFSGWVGISGLADDARVKITDIAGKLTYETPANGGTASWNLMDYTGRRATAGIYLIFCATDDGSEKFVGKIAIID